MSNPKQPWLIRYSYDPLDKLTSQMILSDTAERHRYYCKNRLATEIQGAIGHSIIQHGDFLLAQQQHENNALDTTLLATDVQRSVLHTLKKNIGRQAIAYCPYGHRTALSGLLSLLGFNGERPDPVTGHYLLGNGYRAFNPVLMQFNSPDSLSPFGEGGLNSYTFCLGDPINRADPNGHSAKTFLVALLTGKMSIPGHGRSKILPDVSIRKAMQAKKRIKELNKEIIQSGVTQFFENDKKNQFIPNGQLSLRDLSLNVINSDRRIPSNELPKPLQDAVKARATTVGHFYEEISAQGGGLEEYWLRDMASKGSHVNPNRDKKMLMELAKNYEKRISHIRDYEAHLRSERIAIRQSHFR